MDSHCGRDRHYLYCHNEYDGMSCETSDNVS